MSSNTDDVGSWPKTNVEQQQSQKQGQEPAQKISFRQRIKHLTFAWFLSTMSTGGLAIALGETPHQFPGNKKPPFFASPNPSERKKEHSN